MAVSYAEKRNGEIRGWSVKYEEKEHSIPPNKYAKFVDDSYVYLDLEPLQEKKRMLRRSTNKKTILIKGTERKEFASGQEAASFLNVSSGTLSSAIIRGNKCQEWLVFNDKSPEELGDLDKWRQGRKRTTVLEKDGERKEFASANEAAKFLGVSSAAVKQAAKGVCLCRGWSISYIKAEEQ